MLLLWRYEDIHIYTEKHYTVAFLCQLCGKFVSYNYIVPVFAILTVCLCVCFISLLFFVQFTLALVDITRNLLWGKQSRWQSLLGISLYQQKTNKNEGKTQNMQCVLHTIPLCFISCFIHAMSCDKREKSRKKSLEPVLHLVLVF